MMSRVCAHGKGSRAPALNAGGLARGFGAVHSTWSMCGRAEGCNAWEWEGTEHMWSGLSRHGREWMQPLKSPLPPLPIFSDLQRPG